MAGDDEDRTNDVVMCKPTIYEVLKAKLQREPTHRELCEDVQRILQEGLIERATKGKLRHQRGKF